MGITDASDDNTSTECRCYLLPQCPSSHGFPFGPFIYPLQQHGRYVCIREVQLIYFQTRFVSPSLTPFYDSAGQRSLDQAFSKPLPDVALDGHGSRLKESPSLVAIFFIPFVVGLCGRQQYLGVPFCLSASTVSSGRVSDLLSVRFSWTVAVVPFQLVRRYRIFEAILRKHLVAPYVPCFFFLLFCISLYAAMLPPTLPVAPLFHLCTRGCCCSRSGNLLLFESLLKPPLYGPGIRPLLPYTRLVTPCSFTSPFRLQRLIDSVSTSSILSLPRFPSLFTRYARAVGGLLRRLLVHGSFLRNLTLL